MLEKVILKTPVDKIGKHRWAQLRFYGIADAVVVKKTISEKMSQMAFEQKQ